MTPGTSRREGGRLQMGRILSLDVGDKYIGLAVSDPLGITAQPLRTHRRGSFQEELAFYEALIAEMDIEMILCGLPIGMNGEETSQTGKTRNYAGFLRKRLPVPLTLLDERLTTEASREILDESGYERRNQKQVIDTVSAQILLQDYLEDRRLKQERARARNEEE